MTIAEEDKQSHLWHLSLYTSSLFSNPIYAPLNGDYFRCARRQALSLNNFFILFCYHRLLKLSSNFAFQVNRVWFLVLIEKKNLICQPMFNGILWDIFERRKVGQPQRAKWACRIHVTIGCRKWFFSLLNIPFRLLTIDENMWICSALSTNIPCRCSQHCMTTSL